MMLDPTSDFVDLNSTLGISLRAIVVASALIVILIVAFGLIGSGRRFLAFLKTGTYPSIPRTRVHNMLRWVASTALVVAVLGVVLLTLPPVGQRQPEVSPTMVPGPEFTSTHIRNGLFFWVSILFFVLFAWMQFVSTFLFKRLEHILRRKLPGSGFESVDPRIRWFLRLFLFVMFFLFLNLSR